MSVSSFSRPVLTNANDVEWLKIKKWLQTKYRGQEVPAFERTRESLKLLLELIKLNESQDDNALQTLEALKSVSDSYNAEDIKLQENIQVLGLRTEALSSDSRTLLYQLSELAMLLGISEATKASYHQAFAQLHLDIIRHSHGQKVQAERLSALEDHQNGAQRRFDQLLELRQCLKTQRETSSDIEQRTRRRSVELSKFKAVEDKETLEQLLQKQQDNGLDIERDEVTLTQLEDKREANAELERRLNAQEKRLTAYQEIPPDIALAKLKLKEATLKLDQLTAEHESLLRELANDL
ncbi:HAUS augmin-like complex subunit 1 [Entomortierella beljakovae]|nr:HAUS augmin-like complex subunit 1 [Entomortierella beljakovae]